MSRSVLMHIHKLFLEPKSEQNPRTSRGMNSLPLLLPNISFLMLFMILGWHVQSHNRDRKGFWPSRHPTSEAFFKKGASFPPKSFLMHNTQKTERKTHFYHLFKRFGYSAIVPSMASAWGGDVSRAPVPSGVLLFSPLKVLPQSHPRPLARSEVYTQWSWLSHCSTSWLSPRGKNWNVFYTMEIVFQAQMDRAVLALTGQDRYIQKAFQLFSASSKTLSAPMLTCGSGREVSVGNSAC